MDHVKNLCSPFLTCPARLGNWNFNDHVTNDLNINFLIRTSIFLALLLYMLALLIFGSGCVRVENRGIWSFPPRFSALSTLSHQNFHLDFYQAIMQAISRHLPSKFLWQPARVSTPRHAPNTFGNSLYEMPMVDQLKDCVILQSCAIQEDLKGLVFNTIWALTLS